MKQGIVVIDCGTSSIRAVLFNIDGTLIKKFQNHYSPFYYDDGRCEMDLNEVAKLLYRTLSEVSIYTTQKFIKIIAISVTSQRSSVSALDRNGKPLTNAIMWHDKRTEEICNRFGYYEKTVYQKTGVRIDPIFSAPKMIWFMENESFLMKKLYKFVGIHEFLLFCLTGEFVTDYSIASRSMIFNLFKLDWDQEILNEIGIEKKYLCKLVPQGTICAVTSDKLNIETGIPMNIPVISAGGDQQCSALGLGMINPGQLEINTGTGAYIVALSKRPYLNFESGLICNVAASKGYIIEAGLPTASSTYDWLANILNIKQNYVEMDKLANDAPIGSNGVLFLPYFKGQSTPNWMPYIKGSIHEITMSTKRADLVRSLVEGIALAVAENVQLIIDESNHNEYKINNENKQVILSTGGFSQIDLYNQILSDILNCKIIQNNNAEATSLGGFYSCVVALGIYKSLEVAVNLHSTEKQKGYEPNIKSHISYLEIQKRRKEIFKKMYF